MDDLISRQDAINELSYCQTYLFDSIDRDPKISLEDVKYAIEQLPSAQQWIPCSEMLPMDKGVYLVTDDSGRVAWVEKAWFMWCDDGRPFWEYANVTAWMPLPEPYKDKHED